MLILFENPYRVTLVFRLFKKLQSNLWSYTYLRHEKTNKQSNSVLEKINVLQRKT
jgi:hypothetical protein